MNQQLEAWDESEGDIDGHGRMRNGRDRCKNYHSTMTGKNGIQLPWQGEDPGGYNVPSQSLDYTMRPIK